MGVEYSQGAFTVGTEQLSVVLLSLLRSVEIRMEGFLQLAGVVFLRIEGKFVGNVTVLLPMVV